ncbi:MAG: hypothetical protein EXR72_17205 [Myxococcales bacterium]|nr:hypothetical protein [Myxococcales bacterium]
MTRVLVEVQQALESLYRVEPANDVRDYVITEEHRGALHLDRAPREQLLLREAPGELEIGLFIDQRALRRLEPGLDDANLGEFLLAVEGVSHFLYVMVRARAGRPFSGLELELQAEVDKFLLVLLIAWAAHRGPPERLSERLRDRLFSRVRFHADLSDEERDRYTTANAAAFEYAASLETRYLRRHAIPDMLGEMRRFYRLGCADKLDLIADHRQRARKAA